MAPFPVQAGGHVLPYQPKASREKGSAGIRLAVFFKRRGIAPHQASRFGSGLGIAIVGV